MKENYFSNINDLIKLIDVLSKNYQISLKKIREEIPNLLALKNDEIKDIKLIFCAIESYLLHQGKLNNNHKNEINVNRGFSLKNKNNSFILTGFQFLAMIDNNTCDSCKKLHNIVFSKNSILLKEYTPPLHIGCRCIFSPITKFDLLTPASDEYIRDLNLNLNKPSFQGDDFLEIFVNYLENESIQLQYKELKLKKEKGIFNFIKSFFK